MLSIMTGKLIKIISKVNGIRMLSKDNIIVHKLKGNQKIQKISNSIENNRLVYNI